MDARRQRATRAQDPVAVVRLREPGPADVAWRLHRARHHGGQEPGREAELPVEADVLRALREREEAVVRRSPRGEYLHRALEEPARDAAVPEIRAHRQRSEEPEAPPARHQVRADELAVELGGEGTGGVRAPAGGDEV